MVEMKSFNVKIPKELWLFLKRKSAEEGISMAKVIHKSLNLMKKRYEKKQLTDEDADV